MKRKVLDWESKKQISNFGLARRFKTVGEGQMTGEDDPVLFFIWLANNRTQTKGPILIFYWSIQKLLNKKYCLMKSVNRSDMSETTSFTCERQVVNKVA